MSVGVEGRTSVLATVSVGLDPEIDLPVVVMVHIGG